MGPNTATVNGSWNGPGSTGASLINMVESCFRSTYQLKQAIRDHIETYNEQPGGPLSGPRPPRFSKEVAGFCERTLKTAH